LLDFESRPPLACQRKLQLFDRSGIELKITDEHPLIAPDVVKTPRAPQGRPDPSNSARRLSPTAFAEQPGFSTSRPTRFSMICARKPTIPLVTRRKDRLHAGLERRFGRSLLRPGCLLRHSPDSIAASRKSLMCAQSKGPLAKAWCAQETWETRKNFSSRGSGRGASAHRPYKPQSSTAINQSSKLADHAQGVCKTFLRPKNGPSICGRPISG
jgi:hypothetical protein